MIAKSITIRQAQALAAIPEDHRETRRIAATAAVIMGIPFGQAMFLPISELHAALAAYQKQQATVPSLIESFSIQGITYTVYARPNNMRLGQLAAADMLLHIHSTPQARLNNMHKIMACIALADKWDDAYIAELKVHEERLLDCPLDVATAAISFFLTSLTGPPGIGPQLLIVESQMTALLQILRGRAVGGGRGLFMRWLAMTRYALARSAVSMWRKRWR